MEARDREEVISKQTGVEPPPGRRQWTGAPLLACTGQQDQVHGTHTGIPRVDPANVDSSVDQMRIRAKLVNIAQSRWKKDAIRDSKVRSALSESDSSLRFSF